MQPLRTGTAQEKIVTACVDYSSSWFGLVAPVWEKEVVDGVEKVILAEGPKTSTGETGTNHIDFVAIGRTVSLMIEKLDGRTNVSEDYIAAIGYKAAVTAMHEATIVQIAEAVQ